MQNLETIKSILKNIDINIDPKYSLSSENIDPELKYKGKRKYIKISDVEESLSKTIKEKNISYKYKNVDLLITIDFRKFLENIKNKKGQYIVNDIPLQKIINETNFETIYIVIYFKKKYFVNKPAVIMLTKNSNNNSIDATFLGKKESIYQMAKDNKINDFAIYKLKKKRLN